MARALKQRWRALPIMPHRPMNPDDPVTTLFAPPGGFRVRITDHSAPPDDALVEEITGFPTLAHANEFARRYVRASIESCRAPGLDAEDVLTAWLRFGEDATVPDAEPQGFHGADVASLFASEPAAAEACNWRALDPRNDD